MQELIVLTDSPAGELEDLMLCTQSKGNVQPSRPIMLG